MDTQSSLRNFGRRAALEPDLCILSMPSLHLPSDAFHGDAVYSRADVFVAGHRHSALFFLALTSMLMLSDASSFGVPYSPFIIHVNKKTQLLS